MHSLLSLSRHANNDELTCLQSLPRVPLAKSGTDYAGPFKVRFTKCAVHPELVENYTLESFIPVFHTFTAEEVIAPISTVIKGHVGADKELPALSVEFTNRYSTVVYHRITAEGSR